MILQQWFNFLKARNFFDYDGILCNIASGVHAHESVNDDSSKAHEVTRPSRPTMRPWAWFLGLLATFDLNNCVLVLRSVGGC